MARTTNLIGLDIGTVRIGVAVADTEVRLAVAHGFIEVDGTEIEKIAELILREEASVLVLGLPRNQRGDLTAQSEYVTDFAKKLEYMDVDIIFQDESLTSVLAEDRLKSYKKPYSKGDIDAEAAAIILQDYIERKYASH